MKELTEAQDPLTPAARLRVLAQRDLEHALAVAQNPGAPPDVLQQFVEVFNQDPELIKRVISNPNTPAEALVRYGWSQPEALLQNPIFSMLMLEDPLIIESIPMPTLEKILAQPEVPTQFLERHAGHTDPRIQASIARHPKTPLAALQMLLEKEFASTLVMPSLALTPGLTPEMLEKLASHPSEAVLYEVSKNSKTTPQVLAKLAETKPGFMGKLLKCGLASNPNTPNEVIERLAQEDDDDVAACIAGRQGLPRALLESLAGHHRDLVHNAIFLNKDAGTLRSLYYRAGAADLLRRTKDKALKKLTSPDLSMSLEELTSLSKAGDYARCLVAGHPNTPEELLARLAIAHHEEVRGAVARNPNTPAQVLLLMKKEPSNGLRELLVRHPNTPLELFWSLASDRELDVKLAVASHAKTPQAILKYLFEQGADPKGHLKKAIAKNAGLDLVWLLALAKYRDVGIRLAVAKNPAATPEILALLSTDPTENIRSAVAQHPNTPSGCLNELSQDESPKIAAEANRNQKAKTSA